PRCGQADQPDRAVPGGRRCLEGQCSEGPDAQQQAGRRHGLGRQGPEEVRRELPNQDRFGLNRNCRSPLMVSAVFHSPLEVAAESRAAVVAKPVLASPPVAKPQPVAVAAPRSARPPYDWSELWLK